jgi:uncharacterized membrane protein
MKTLNEFLRTTIFGGVVFLVPLVLILIVLRHALQLAMKLAHPIAELMPDGGISRPALATLVAALILVLIAFVAGLASRTTVGRRLTRWFEESLLGGLPQYRMAKSVAESFAHVESDAAQMRPALVLIDEGWQLAYRLEDLPGGWVAVFVPQSPTPMSGNVLYVKSERVRPLHVPMKDVILLVKRLGVGSSAALAGLEFARLETAPSGTKAPS